MITTATANQRAARRKYRFSNGCDSPAVFMVGPPSFPQ
jgi:hypothetical protein